MFGHRNSRNGLKRENYNYNAYLKGEREIKSVNYIELFWDLGDIKTNELKLKSYQ